MKLVGLVPYKNEEKMLPTFLSVVTKCVDEIVAIDDGSTDRSTEIMKEAGVSVYGNETEVEAGWAELSIRQKLLRLGREHGGTHFAVMDADETFTGQFPNYIDRVCSKLEPGHKVKMQWLAMWKSVDHYRDDDSVWSNNYKDFIFHDDGKMEYPDVWMHTPRTPGRTEEDNCFALNPKYGAVFHFQFSDWDEFQIKQAWYRCSEFKRNGWAGAPQINQKYSITNDDPNSIVTAVPASWKSGVVFPDIKYRYHTDNWRLQQIKEWFKEYGPEKFNPLQIWHVPQIRALVQELA